MGILQTSLPRKNDLSLDKLLLGFILGKKYTYIEINAKVWLENLYYSFISITGLVRRQQSHLKHLLACWQSATETRWTPLANGGGEQVQPPRESSQIWQWDVFFFFFLEHKLFSLSGVYVSRRTPPIWTRVFSGFCTFLWVLVHVRDKLVFQHRRTTGIKGKRNAPHLSGMRGPARAGSVILCCLHQRLAE